jgi:hypothetical protein
MDEKRYFNLDHLLFEGEDCLSKKYHKDGYLNAEDFFCILIWKANRAKSNHAKRLLHLNPNQDLETICINLTTKLFELDNDEERFNLLKSENYQFRLPTISAIMAVYNPNEFSIYDYRACDVLKEYGLDFNTVNNWKQYNKYNNAVKNNVIQYENLRDKDRYLWGRSFYNELVAGIKKGFKQ